MVEKNPYIKINVRERPSQKEMLLRIAARKFIEESCEFAKMLPPHKKLMFVMHYSHGYSISEIADLCKVPVNTVSKRIKQIADEINTMRNLVKEADNGEVNQSTKERIETYFRREAERRRSFRESKNISETV